MSKILKYDDKVNESILAGVEKLEKAVASTLGPRGRTVLIDRGDTVHITKDGVTVAESISLKDKFEDLAVSTMKEVAQKTNTMVGDGTTTSTVLAASVYKNGIRHVAMGANPVHVKNGIELAANHVVEFIKSKAKKISTKEEIEQVATVSANGDKEIGEVIADVMSKIGNDGTIKVEDGNTTSMSSKIVEGMAIERGYISPYFITNEKMEADLQEPYIILSNKKLSNAQELVPVLQALSQSGKPILIIAEDIEGEALSMVVMNKLRGLPICAIKSPSYGDNRKAIMDDIAVLVGGKVVSEETGVTLQDAANQPGIIGCAKRVIVTKDTTTIVDGLGEKFNIDARVAEIRTQIDASDNDFDKGRLKERLAKIVSGVGIIQVGAQTEAELKEKRDRVEDAFNATKAAVKEGIVAGGGAALIMAKSELISWLNHQQDLNGDVLIGANILVESLEAPIRKILANAGLDSSLIVQTLLTKDEENLGYDVLTGDYVNMVDAGIIDPCLVTESAVKNAASIASLLLTTSVMIAEEPIKNHSCCCGDQQMPMGMM